MPGGSNGHALVVGHGAAIRVWVAGRATSIPVAFAGAHELENTDLGELSGSSAGPPRRGARSYRGRGHP